MAEGLAFEEQLAELGFERSGQSRWGGRMWTLAFNRYLEFTLHDYHDNVVLTWSLNLGEFVETRGMQLGSGETSYHELYPRNDVKLPIDGDAIRAELTRTLGLLRFDFADPNL